MGVGVGVAGRVGVGVDVNVGVAVGVGAGVRVGVGVDVGVGGGVAVGDGVYVGVGVAVAELTTSSVMSSMVMPMFVMLESLFRTKAIHTWLWPTRLARSSV